MSRSELHKVLVSACLLGQPVRYDGRASGHPDLLQLWQAEGRVVPLCPEVAGGLPTPRPPAEIPGGQGGEVGVERVEGGLVVEIGRASCSERLYVSVFM